MYETVSKNFTNTRQVPKGDDLYYRCTNCSVVIPSIPDNNIACKCGNVYIDIDYFRLSIKDYTKFEVVKKKD